MQIISSKHGKALEIGHLIGGEEVFDGQVCERRNPADQADLIARFPEASKETLRKAANTAHKAFQEWSRTPAPIRGVVLMNLASVLTREKDTLVRLMVREVGKTFKEAGGDVQEAIDTAIERRPEIVQAKKNVESGELNKEFARNQLLPTLSLQGTIGLSGLGKDYGDSFTRNFGGDFYNYGAGLVLSYPLGNRSALSTYNKRQLEAKNAEAALASVRQQIIVGVREAVRRVQTDFKRIETTRSARIMAEKQLQAERERLRVGLSTTRFVLDFQRDLAVAQANELRAVIDYNKSLSNLARHKATTLDRYHIQLE